MNAGVKVTGSMPAKKEPDLTTYRGRFAARLRELRGDKSVAKVLSSLKRSGHEISPATYYNWESAATDPPLNTIPSLAKALGCSVSELFPET
jgi:transcriptional regulator with XRE-family HTH domain